MSDPDGRRPRPIILSCGGPVLSDAEKRLFSASDPLGFILFRRNVETPDQLRLLTASLRDAVGRTEVPILIDQEGGRVQRMAPPHWRTWPPAAVFGRLYARDRAGAVEAARLAAHLMAVELAAVGIDVDCLPVLDVPTREADAIIGDRAFADDPAVVAVLGGAMCEGLGAGGVAPVVKHIPGHGRAPADSHFALPVVDAPLDALRGSDFRPFHELRDAPYAMTAHVVYRAIDPDRPASLSPQVIDRVIRGEIGFDGLLMSDDLMMAALAGTPEARARAVLDAGCDVALYCAGEIDAMAAIAAAVPPMGDASWRRWLRAQAGRQPARMPPDDGAERLRRLLQPLAEE